MQSNHVLQLFGYLIAKWDLVFRDDCGGQTFQRRIVDQRNRIEWIDGDECDRAMIIFVRLIKVGAGGKKFPHNLGEVGNNWWMILDSVYD